MDARKKVKFQGIMVSSHKGCSDTTFTLTYSSNSARILHYLKSTCGHDNTKVFTIFDESYDKILYSFPYVLDLRFLSISLKPTSSCTYMTFEPLPVEDSQRRQQTTLETECVFSKAGIRSYIPHHTISFSKPMLPSTTWCTRSVTFRAFFPGQYMIYGFRIMSEDVVSAVISAFVTEGGYYETRLMPVNPSDTEFDIMNSHRLTRYHTIHPPVKASGLNLGVMRYKLKRNFWLCMKIAVHGHPIVKHLEPVVQDIPECKKYVISQLGMSSGKINNDSIKASSSANSSSPYFARLNHPDGWSPSTADSAPWLQIRLPKMAVVYGFVAAVRSTFHAAPSFHVKYAENEDEELKYAMDPYFNDIAIFPMRSSVVNTVETEEDLPVPLRATIVRIILLKHARFNFELYGIYPDSQSS